MRKFVKNFKHEAYGIKTLAVIASYINSILLARQGNKSIDNFLFLKKIVIWITNDYK